jgi:hypothetical protein
MASTGFTGAPTASPGSCLFVGTAFFHLFFIPLIPLGSYIVLEKDDEWEGFKGIHIGLSFKSWLYAWGRATAVLSVPIVLAVFYTAYTRPNYLTGVPGGWTDSPGWAGIAGIVLAIGAWWFMRTTSVASDARAAELLQMAGLEMVPAGEPVKT